MKKHIRFCFNPVSLDAKGLPLPEGQAARLADPVVPWLTEWGDDWSIGAQPQEGAVNVYYAHRSAYRKVRREIGVFVSHGIADKGWRNATAPYYRATFVSGPRWTARLLDHNAPPHVIFEVGYAKLDPLFQARQEREIMRLKTGTHPTPITVLWAPTHGGGGESSYFLDPTPDNEPSTFNSKRSSWWHRDEILAALDQPGLRVVECPHPRHRRDGRATFEELATADVVVADGGSTIYEAWALGIPVVFPTWLTYFGNTEGNSVGTLEADIYRRAIGRHAADDQMLPALVREAALMGITDPERAFVEPILPSAYRGISGLLHAETLHDLANGVDSPRNCPPIVWQTFTLNGRTRRAAVGTKMHEQLSQSGKWSVK